MKSFREYIKEQRVVTFDASKEPNSAIGAVDEDRLVKTATILMDGASNQRNFRLALVYVNPRRDDGRTFDVFPAYGSPACATCEELRALDTKANDVHGVIAKAIEDFEKTPLYQNLQAKGA